LGKVDNESAWGRDGTEISTSAGAGSMAGVESAAALLAGAIAGGAATTGLAPIVAGANAGPGVEVIAALAFVAAAAALPSAGAVAREVVTRFGGLDSGGSTRAGAGAGCAVLIDSGLGATGVAGASGRAEARMTTKVQPMITAATTANCSGRRLPARARAGEACATGSSAGVTSG
jgi:hypothetical protein